MIKLTFGKQHPTKIILLTEEMAKNTYKDLVKEKIFTGAGGEVLSELNFNRVGALLAGFGKGKKEENLDKLRLYGFNLGNKLKQEKIRKATLDLSGFDEKEIRLLLSGLLYSNYNFNNYKTDKKDEEDIEVSLVNANNYKSLVKEIQSLVESVFLSRDLVNLRSNDIYPEAYTNKIIELFKDSKVEVTVFNKKGIEKLDMKAFLEVNKGSDKEPRFVVLKYQNNPDSKDFIAVVGKGLTYDSGGYDIKPGPSMRDMHCDMAGSAAVVGLFKALSDNNVKTNAYGVMALTENLINGKAYKTGDIISSMKGLTIEVNSTDAEGRLTLADALYYTATKLKPTNIIELSTLTGACVYSLGYTVTGAVTNNDKFYDLVHKAGIEAGELSWKFPVTEDYEEMVKAKHADLDNAPRGGGGGTITAGLFLNHFVEKIPYVHLDIAGTAFLNAPQKYYSKGATGVGVRTLYYLLKERGNKF